RHLTKSYRSGGEPVKVLRGVDLTVAAGERVALTRDLVARTGCGFLMVTHSARLAAMLDRQVHLHAGRVA
ncbi:MAG: hypothetical protein E6699_27990, partial [Bradyrhizobium sp.]|nr:hypothetical protein [Bradyrhizobium sp.]